MIPRDVVERIRERADIVEVISDYVRLKPSGRNFKGLCPFHREKTPSFVVSPEKQLFHCFGCGAGGNVFTFLMRYEHMSFQEAVKALAQRYGIEVPEVRTGSRREGYLQVNRLALRYFRERLLHPREGRPARDYLLGRGIEPKMWETYSLGYAPPGWEGLKAFLQAQGARLEDAEEVGLLIKGTKGLYDRFRSRLIFPIEDQRGRVLGFGGRILGEGEPKYLNSPDSPIYHKGEVLYGMRPARDYIIGEKEAIVVEGYFDVLSLAQNGVRNVVAPLGTALTVHQLRLLKPLVEKVILLFDGDEAGKKAALRGVEALVEEGMEGEVVILPPGEDPDSFIRTRGREELLRDRRPALNFYLEELIKGFDLDSPEGRFKAAGAVVSFLQRIDDPMRRRFYARYASEALGIEEEMLLSRMDFSPPPSTEHKALLPTEEETLVALMVQHPEVISWVREAAVLEHFSSPVLREVAEEALRIEEEGGDPRMEIPPLLEERGVGEGVFAAAFTEGEEAFDRIFKDCVRRIKLKSLRQQREGLLQEIRRAEREGDEKLLQALLLRQQILLKEERALVRGAE